MKILIVDDSISARKIIFRALHELGIKKIFEAKEGQEALRILEKVPDMDLIFVDWEMPVMDGVAFIEKVRSLPSFKRLKIVMTTVKSSKEDVIRALEAGADHYIAKPFSDKTLIPKIKPFISSLAPVQHIEDFITLIREEKNTKVSIGDETLYLDLSTKRIAIDIPALIYHGIMRLESKEASPLTERREEEFIPLHED